jgi:uncharacterized cupredoxin-like copper-binding protein
MLVGACGGDGGSEAEPATPAPAASETTVTSAQAGGAGAVEITGTEFRLDPAAVALEAPGKSYTVRFVNNGSAPHALVIEGEGVDEETETIEPGESSELTIDLTEDEYEIYCPVSDHRERGMEGTLTVEGGSQAG